MIRYKDKIFEDYFIAPLTAKIYDSNGIEQEIKVYKDGRAYFNSIAVYKIWLTLI